MYTTGTGAHNYITGTGAHRYTTGTGAHMYTTGTRAHMYTTGTRAQRYTTVVILGTQQSFDFGALILIGSNLLFFFSLILFFHNNGIHHSFGLFRENFNHSSRIYCPFGLFMKAFIIIGSIILLDFSRATFPVDGRNYTSVELSTSLTNIRTQQNLD